MSTPLDYSFLFFIVLLIEISVLLTKYNEEGLDKYYQTFINYFYLVLFPVDNLIRHKIDDEIEQLKTKVNRILSEQQQEFAQAFGLHDDHSSSEVCYA